MSAKALAEPRWNGDSTPASGTLLRRLLLGDKRSRVLTRHEARDRVRDISVLRSVLVHLTCKELARIDT